MRIESYLVAENEGTYFGHAHSLMPVLPARCCVTFVVESPLLYTFIIYRYEPYIDMMTLK
jgi:hypothetical protein